MFHQVEKAHDADLHCVDWNPHDENLILTGYVIFCTLYLKLTNLALIASFCAFRSADNSVHMFDRRNLTINGVGSPVHKFQGHDASVLCVQVSISFIDLVAKDMIILRYLKNVCTYRLIMNYDTVVTT